MILKVILTYMCHMTQNWKLSYFILHLVLRKKI